MIEGIDYYPKKSKNKLKIKHWALLLIVVLAAMYWYFNAQQNLETSGPTTIIISEPQIKPIVNTTPIIVKPTEVGPKVPELLENLDEVLQNQTIQNIQ